MSIEAPQRGVFIGPEDGSDLLSIHDQTHSTRSVSPLHCLKVLSDGRFGSPVDWRDALASLEDPVIANTVAFFTPHSPTGY